MFTHSVSEISDAPIIRSVIGIGHYQPLFLVSVSTRCNPDIVKSAPIMSFFVIIVLLISFKILIITFKMNERIRSQNCPEGIDII